MRKKQKYLQLRFDRILSQNIFKQMAVLLCALIILFAASFILLSLADSDWESFCTRNGVSKWLLPLYMLIDTNLFNSIYLNSAAHGWMIFVSGLTYVAGILVFNGMIISAMTNALGRRVQQHQEGFIFYLQSGHYIIMGYDDMVPSIIADILAHDPEAYILILTSADALKIKEKLTKRIDRRQMKRIIINCGHRTSPEVYRDIRIESAKEVFIVGNRTRPAHDAINVECVERICTYLAEKANAQLAAKKPDDKQPVDKKPDDENRPKVGPDRITCVFEDLDTYAAFKTSEIFGAVRALGIEFVPYNFYTGWAQQVFIKRCHRDKRDPANRICYPSVCGNGIGVDDDRHVHLVFVGTGNFAVALAIEAAHVLHFPNFRDGEGPRTRITFIDPEADREMRLFRTRNRHLFDIEEPLYRDLSGDDDEKRSQNAADVRRGFLDVEFEFIKGDIFSKRVQDEICRWTNDPQRCLSIFLAMDDQRSNFATGMNMPDEIYDNNIPIFIRQDRSDNFVTNLRTADAGKEFPYTTCDPATGALKVETRNGRYANIYPFGMNDTAFTSDEEYLHRAKLINYLYSTADYDTYKFRETSELDSISGENTMKLADEKWRELSTAIKWSNLYAAYSIPYKLLSIRTMRGLQPDDTSLDTEPLSDDLAAIMARVEHNRWNVEKLLMGYRRVRPEEDKYLHADDKETAKLLERNKKLFIHHDIRPYGELGIVSRLDIEFCKYLSWILKTEPER